MAGLADRGGVLVGAQAPGAQVEAQRLAALVNGHRVDIGFPAPGGVPFGMAHVMPELGRFAAQVALQISLSIDG